jgi:hypothetical protein
VSQLYLTAAQVSYNLRLSGVRALRQAGNSCDSTCEFNVSAIDLHVNPLAFAPVILRMRFVFAEIANRSAASSLAATHQSEEATNGRERHDSRRAGNTHTRLVA